MPVTAFDNFRRGEPEPFLSSTSASQFNNFRRTEPFSGLVFLAAFLPKGIQALQAINRSSTF